MMIRLATELDSAQMAEIYNHYILNSTITFEEEPLTSKEMSKRITSTLDDQLPWFVAEDDGEILGYAYASKWKGRCAYRYSVESTAYLKHNSQGKGLGSQLYDELLKALRLKNIHMVLAGIALPNEPSVTFHEKYGFEKVAHFKQVGNKFNQWVDVGYWQLGLER